QAGLERRHASYYCALAERAEPELQGPAQRAWLERLEREHDNLRAALAWCAGSGVQAFGRLGVREQPHFPECPNAPTPSPASRVPGLTPVEIGLRLAGALWEFWAPRGHVAEGRAHLTKLLAHPEAAARTAVRAKALACTAILADFQGQHAAARSLHEEGLAIRRELNDRWGIDFS